MGLPSICYGLLVYESILIASAVGGIALRFTAMYMIRRKLKTHDFLAVSALVGCMGYIIATMIATANYGYGYHQSEVPPKKLTLALKVFWAVEPFWALSTVSFRIAILLLYVELFGTVKKLRYSAWILLAIVTAWGISCIISQMLFCRPIHANWDLTVKGSCGNTMDLLVWSAAINMILDLIIVTLPLPIIWKLHMTTKKKIGVTFQFSIGLILCGVNVGRIILPALCGTTDTTYCSPGTFMLSATELAGGIWAACLPLLGPIFNSSGDRQGIFPSKPTNSEMKSTIQGKDSDDNGSLYGNKRHRPQSQGFDRPHSHVYDQYAVDRFGELSDQASTLRDDTSVKEDPDEDNRNEDEGENDNLGRNSHMTGRTDSGVIWVQQDYDIDSVTRANSAVTPNCALR